MRKIFLILLSAALILSCAKAGDNKNASKLSGDNVAKVGPEFITKAEVSKRMTSLMESLPDYLKSAYQGEEGTRKIVDELVKTELLYLQAKKDGMDRNPDYLAKVEDYKKYALVQLTFDKIMKENTPKNKLTEKDAKAFYDQNREKFNLASQVKASHILVKTKAEADDIEKELKSGKDFASLAKAKSVDATSAKNGGDLGFFSKGQMAPEFEAAAFALKKGEISEPIKSQFGYHIIKVTDKKGGSIVEFSKVKDMIIQKLDQDRQQEAFNNYIEKVKKQYPVEINDAALKDLQKKETATEKKQPK